MKRIYPDFAYGPGPRTGCWWDETIATPSWAELRGDRKADVAIIGGGFTGMSAALHLAESGASVALLEAQAPGWGASGRNGGFAAWAVPGWVMPPCPGNLARKVVPTTGNPNGRRFHWLTRCLTGWPLMPIVIRLAKPNWLTMPAR